MEEVKRAQESELTNSPGKNWEKVRLLYTSSHRKCKSGKIEWTLWTTPENSKTSNQPAMEDYPAFPVNRQLFRVLVVCWAATKACDMIHGTCLVHRETLLTIHLHQSTHHRHLTEDCRSEERNRDTLPTPRFARRPSARNSLSSWRSVSTELYGWPTQTPDLGASLWQTSHTPSTFF